jgi:D-serine deaminase-like pyridoxal phosphate-dependent protein
MRLNSDLVGVENSVKNLQTPALLIDIDAFESNLKKMAEWGNGKNIALRPHAKTHKCSEIARRQIELGAIGQCCAKLGEAEVLASSGLSGILITSPIVTNSGIKRFINLAQKSSDILLVADNPQNVKDIAAAADAAGIVVNLLVDIDVGLKRTGVANIEQGVALAKLIANNDALKLHGIQAYAGHAMHIHGKNERNKALTKAAKITADLRDAMTQIGCRPEIITGGGTGSFETDDNLNVFTELQAGSYIFMDREYNEIWSYKNENVPFKPSLFVLTTVISTNWAGHCTTDAGCKSFATEAGRPIIVSGAPDGAIYDFFGDEQGLVSFASLDKKLNIGDKIKCIPPHCDPSVNLYDCYHIIKDNCLIDFWEIDARGRSQ